MAISIGKLRYDVVGDASGLREELASIRAPMRNVNKLLRDAQTPMDKYKKGLDDLRIAEAKGKITREQYIRGVSQLKKVYQQQTTALEKTTAAQKSLDKATKGFTATQREATQAGNARVATMRRADAAMASMATRLGLVAVATAGAATAWRGFLGQFERIDELAKTSRKLGVAVNELQAMRLAGEQLAGMSAGSIDMALQRMTRRLSEAAAGAGEAQGAIKELGLDAQRLNSMALSVRPLVSILQLVDQRNLSRAS